MERVNKRREVLNRILEEYPFTSTKVLAERYGKSPSAIEGLVRRHGVRKMDGAKRQCAHVIYPKQERVSSVKTRHEGIIQDYPYYTNEELAVKYETTIGAVKSVGEKHHLKKDRQHLHARREEAQRERLAAYAYRDTRDMAFELGISPAALGKMARKLGIKKN